MAVNQWECQRCRSGPGEQWHLGIPYCESCYRQVKEEASLPTGFICKPHSSKATHFCTCSGVREYLCQECYQKHMKKDLNHVLVRVDASELSLEEVRKLNLKVALQANLNNQLQSMLQMLEVERQSMQKFLKEYENFHENQLHAAYCRLKETMDGHYHVYASYFYTLLEELKSSAAAPNVSPNLALFINYSTHLLDISHVFIPVQEELEKSIQFTYTEMAALSDEPLKTLLVAWNGDEKKCGCEQCEENRDLYGLAMQRVWRCFNCCVENKGTKTCHECFCGREWTDYLSVNDVKLTPDLKKWICPDCSTKNDIYDGHCKCKKVNSVIINGLSPLPRWVKKITNIFTR